MENEITGDQGVEDQGVAAPERELAARWVVRSCERRDVARVETLLRKHAPHLRGRLDPLGRSVENPGLGAAMVAEDDGVVVAVAWACNRFAAMDDVAVPMWVLEALEVRSDLVGDGAAELAGAAHSALVGAARDAGVAVLIGVGDAAETHEWDTYGYRRVPAGCSLLYTCDETGAVIPVSSDGAHVLYVLDTDGVTPALDAVAMIRDGLEHGGRIEVIPGGADVIRQLVEQMAVETEAS